MQIKSSCGSFSLCCCFFISEVIEQQMFSYVLRSLKTEIKKIAKNQSAVYQGVLHF